jgi:hypothetical protein
MSNTRHSVYTQILTTYTSTPHCSRNVRTKLINTPPAYIGTPHDPCHAIPSQVRTMFWSASLFLGVGFATSSLGTEANDAPQHTPRAPPSMQWMDAATLVENTGMAPSVSRLPYGRLPNAAKTGELCSPPCPVRDQGALRSALYSETIMDCCFRFMRTSLEHRTATATQPHNYPNTKIAIAIYVKQRVSGCVFFFWLKEHCS